MVWFAVSAFRYLFPNRYVHRVVSHHHPSSGIARTRSLATVSEMALIAPLSVVLGVLNTERGCGIGSLAWGMVVIP